MSIFTCHNLYGESWLNVFWRERHKNKEVYQPSNTLIISKDTPWKTNYETTDLFSCQWTKVTKGTKVTIAKKVPHFCPYRLHVHEK